MDKKKIKVSYLLLPLSMLLSITVQSQEFWTEELQWQDTNELYQSMVNFVNEEPYEKFKLPKVVDVGLDNYLWAVFTKKKREKSFAEQKKIEQEKVKNFLETHLFRRDTILEFVFFDKDQILKWKGDYHPKQLRTEEFHIKNTNIFILIADDCFGIYCPHIFIFKERKGLWKLVTSTSAKLKEMFTIKIDNNEEKIVFETTLGKIGELSFDLLLNSN